MNKMSILAILSLMISSPAWAATYTIELEAQSQGAKPFKGTVSVNEGKKGSISFEDTSIQFVPTLAKNGSVKIQAEIFKKTAHGLELVSKPSVITRMNQSAEISQRQDKGAEVFRLKLTPKSP
jgi:hypothetical protein